MTPEDARRASEKGSPTTQGPPQVRGLPQVQGVVGRGVDWMIRRAVRRSFRSVYWNPPKSPIRAPAILVANHHGWHDGYLMYLAARKMELPVVDWIQEFDSFPLFAKVGGMPFPAEDPVQRAVTVRETIRRMRSEGRSLILFAEGTLHRAPELMRFGRSLELVSGKVPQAQVVPVAIRYEMGMHERPEAYLAFGESVETGPDLAFRARLAVGHLIDRLVVEIGFAPDSLPVLVEGTKDVNERMNMRGVPRISRGKSQRPRL